MDRWRDAWWSNPRRVIGENEARNEIHSGGARGDMIQFKEQSDWRLAEGRENAARDNMPLRYAGRGEREKMWAWLTKIRQDFGAWIVMRGKGMWVVGCGEDMARWMDTDSI